MIRECTEADVATIDAIINDAAHRYRGAVPADCLHEPYMPEEELRAEIAAGVRFWGWQDPSGHLVGVMGLQQVRDATLIRHAYVAPSHQGHGIGGALLDDLIHKSAGLLLVGTWAAATWAIRFYESHGFRLVSTEEKDCLLKTYWNIPPRQRATSVVLRFDRDLTNDDRLPVDRHVGGAASTNCKRPHANPGGNFDRVRDRNS